MMNINKKQLIEAIKDAQEASYDESYEFDELYDVRFYPNESDSFKIRATHHEASDGGEVLVSAVDPWINPEETADAVISWMKEKEELVSSC